MQSVKAKEGVDGIYAAFKYTAVRRVSHVPVTMVYYCKEYRTSHGFVIGLERDLNTPPLLCLCRAGPRPDAAISIVSAPDVLVGLNRESWPWWSRDMRDKQLSRPLRSALHRQYCPEHT